MCVACASAGASLSEGLWLGRGDRKTRRGKIAVGTSGLARPSLRNARRERERRLLGPFQSPRAWSNFDPDAQQETRAMRRLRCVLSLSLCTRGLCAAPARSASAMRRSSSGCGSTRVPESKRQSTDFHFFVAFVVRVVCLCVCFFAHCARASGLTLSMTDSMRRCSHPRENGGLEKDDLLI